MLSVSSEFSFYRYGGSFSLDDVKSLFQLLSGYPIRYNTKARASSGCSDVYHHYEDEIGDPDGTKFDKVKSQLFHYYRHRRGFSMHLEFFPTDDDSFYFPFHIMAGESVREEQTEFVYITIEVERREFYTCHGPSIYKYLLPLIRDLFREYNLEVGYFEKEGYGPEHRPSKEALKAGKFDVLTGINFYTEKYRESLPHWDSPHWGKEILLDEKLGLYCLVLNENPYEYPIHEQPADEISLNVGEL